MLFSSVVFIGCFLPPVLLVYYTLLKGKRLLQNYFLLFASLVFYAWGEPLFVFALIGSFTGNWAFGLLIGKHRGSQRASKLILVLMLAFNLSVIFVFKYLMFTVANVNLLLGASFAVPLIVLPIGISFFTFQAISYVVDVYRGRKAPQKNLLNVGLYIAFFPQLVAGPIIRYETIADQIAGREESFSSFSIGACRFIVGLSKKVLLANSFAVVADKSFAVAQAGDLSVSFAWLGAIAYALQIFFDFSGYSDMAIGLGRMFGFRFPENFNYPYISKSATEFWRRWHISLGSWFRDYVYFPLGGSRVSSRARLVLNLFIVWLLTGIWHGANWTFVCWGLLYFALIAIEKTIQFEKLPLPGFLKRTYILLFVLVGWVLFRSGTVADAAWYLKVMFGFSGSPLTDANAAVYLKENLVYFLFGILSSTPAAKAIIAKAEGAGALRSAASVGYAAIFALVFLISLSYLAKGTYNPFIYFNF
ncbi:MAG: MBOAT family protein [Clostridiales bacterium]|nr:MBOAT family protein [Clostridiales bacterium]